jgi:aryl-alcohol dehydrogenase-like predicted oxidoreductase
MHTRTFGNTDLRVSIVGFGAWAIGGAAMAGDTPIGWGPADDDTSRAALRAARDHGITFFDTADFYGLGHSETLIGEVIGNSPQAVVATKVGHRLNDDGTIALDYSAKHIRAACERSLRRLRRDTIDLYQLHSAKVAHFEQGDCLTELDKLRQEGKIRYWGVSLHTFSPQPEAEYLLSRGSASGFQVVLNLMNRRALPTIERARQAGVGVIARMPLQFGLLTGRMTAGRTFAREDHRSFRLTPEIIERTRMLLEPAWRAAIEAGVTPSQLAMSYVASTPGVSTVIPGIRTPEQAFENANAIAVEGDRVRECLQLISEAEATEIVALMQSRG